MKRNAAETARVRALVRARSPLAPDETERVIAAEFGAMPPIVAYLRARFGFGARRVLEVGSHFGRHLSYWGAGSEGIDARPAAARFTTALGFPTRVLNVEDGFGSLSPGAFDAVHSNNLLEHLVAPHLFLLRVHRLLAAGGVLVVGHPVVPRARRLWEAGGIRGWAAAEHVSFFTPATVRLTCERAGFEVVEQLAPALLRLHPRAARLGVGWLPGCYSICRKRPAFRYDAKRDPVFDPTALHDELAPLHAAAYGASS